MRAPHPATSSVVAATDAAGRKLAVAAEELDILAQDVPNQAGAAVFGGNGQVQLVASQESNPWRTFVPTATQTVVRLKAGDEAPTSLKSFDGVIRGAVRSDEEVLATIAGLDHKPTGSVLGAGGVAMGVTVTAQPGSASYFLSVVLRYNPTEVQVSGQPDHEVTLINQGRGRVAVRQVRGGFGPGRQSGTFGLKLTTDDGMPFTLSLSSSRRTYDRNAGEGTDTITLTAQPSATDLGEPAKLTLTGTRTKTVEVPFQLTDVPVKAGTAALPKE